MSRAFVKEQDVDTVEHLADRPVSEHPNIVTDRGMAQIDTALAEARVAHAAAQASSDRASIGAAAREVRYWSAGVRARNSFLLRATLQKSGSAPRSRSCAMMGVSRPSELSGRTKRSEERRVGKE